MGICSFGNKGTWSDFLNSGTFSDCDSGQTELAFDKLGYLSCSQTCLVQESS